jgi:hypothetical protein
MARKGLLSAFASIVVSLGALSLAPAASAATTTRLLMNQGAAFSILHYSCGGISEKVYMTGFESNGYPIGAALLSTTCSGSGRGGHPTTHTAWGSVTWDWYAETRSSAAIAGPPEGISETFSATDSFGDHIYNTGTSAYLETTSPPVKAPDAPTGVTAVGVRIGEEGAPPEDFQVSWTPAPETAGLITSSTVTATPVGSPAPVLTVTTSGAVSGARLGPVEPSTTYKITVTNTDLEGTSEPGNVVEIKSNGNEEEVGEKEREEQKEERTAGPPEFGRCVKAPSEQSGKTTFYYGAYATATCTTTSETHTGKFEWEPGVVQNGFKTTLKSGVATLESTSKAKVTCTGASSTGLVTGLKKVGSVDITLTGCETGGQKCTTAGLAEGELQTSFLEGVIGVEKTTTVNGKEVKHIAMALFPIGRTGSVLQYTCTGGELMTLGGAILVPVIAGKMTTSSTVKYAATGGKQKPESFEGEDQEVLTNGFGEQVGLSLSSTETTEEAIEINPTV